MMEEGIYKERLKRIWEIVQNLDTQDVCDPDEDLALRHDRALLEIHDELIDLDLGYENGGEKN